jgi:hypothetical protein
LSLCYSALIGLLGGIISTAIMTITEIQSWKRWGLHGVFEWHENEVITTRVFSLSDSSKIHFKGIFFFHFLNGALAGIAFPFIASSFTIAIHYVIPFSLLGILYGIILWILTLAPIHKPITGFSPWNHPLGHVPSLASLGGHVLYGIVLGIVLSLFIEQHVV